MIRIALYLVCATAATVVGAKMIYMATAQAQAPDAADEKCDEHDLKKYPHRPEVQPKITEPAEEDEEKSPIIKELLKLVDEIRGGEDNSKDNRNLLRKVLREADPELARSLGKNSLRLIQEANRRPPVIDVAKHCVEERDKKPDEEEKKPEPEKKSDNKQPAGEDPFGDQ